MALWNMSPEEAAEIREKRQVDWPAAIGIVVGLFLITTGDIILGFIATLLIAGFNRPWR